ncbi:hypothetical protein G7Y89_g11351 [Cudoniella acicularis]|uniref:Uncharacterized protein n=1 Tax=Cudoniella acicularis TaxID=354080 RepID=A0A8H4RB15_9HELO|nr:hypothetical protein G7Y89_g11351 [Cudoniella acicularis]
MPPKIKLYVGAPESNRLDWDESGLLSSFSEPFLRFAKLQQHTGHEKSAVVPVTPTSTFYPEWRSLPLERQHLATGISQDHGWHSQFLGGANFFTISQVDSMMEELSQQAKESFESNISVQSKEQLRSQFYEESYGRHQDIASSQITDFGGSFTSDESSFDKTQAFDSLIDEVLSEIPNAGPLSNIKDLPGAAYLDSIQPQTMTVNLIVGIISLPTARTINTRRGGHTELVEAIVGDDTKSGLAVNFWFSSFQLATANLKADIEALRPQDVVLMRNVALSSFRGRVYGQSLRQGMTKVHLLFRNRVDHADVGGCYRRADLDPGNHGNVQLERTKRVREWVLRFVGNSGPQRQRDSGDYREFQESLPPDTQ